MSNFQNNGFPQFRSDLYPSNLRLKAADVKSFTVLLSRLPNHEQKGSFQKRRTAFGTGVRLSLCSVRRAYSM